MKRLEWNGRKSALLKRSRGISFEDIIRERLVDVLEHPTRPNQTVLVFEREGYCWAVPCVRSRGGWFLKTIYPSRKMTRKYLRKDIS